MKKKILSYILIPLIAVLLNLHTGEIIGASKLQLLNVSVIDVGQGDSILIKTPNYKNILIDAGPDESKNKLIGYLKAQNIKKIDVLVATHPHEDHIGGMDDIVKSFDIGNVYMPRAQTNTYTFENLLRAIKNKNLKVNTAKAGVQLNIDPLVKIKMLAPNSAKYEDLNNYSAVIKLQYNKTSFLFQGDAGTLSEKEMLRAGCDLRADVLKVGHHGSNYSTSVKFLKAVLPKFAAISVGKNNRYRHPAKTTISKLQKQGVKTYRTDTYGTVVFISDGNTIFVK